MAIDSRSGWRLLLVPAFLAIIAAGAARVEDVRFTNESYKYFLAWKDPSKYKMTELWSYDSGLVAANDAKKFNAWFKGAKFKDIAGIANAYFLKGPVTQNVAIEPDGILRFSRAVHDRDPHTMIELSVNNNPARGNFVKNDGYRSMALGVPYEFELSIRADSGTWSANIPWVVVFQGHSMADVVNVGKKYNPPFALVVTRGRWAVDVRADSRINLPVNRSYERSQRIDLGPVDPGCWTTFVFRVMWGFMDAPNEPSGALGIWRDGQVKYEEWGRKNFYKNRSSSGRYLGPYVTFGAYTPTGKSTEAVGVSIQRLVLRQWVLNK